MFLGRILCSHIASLHQVMYMGNEKLLQKLKPCNVCDGLISSSGEKSNNPNSSLY